MDAKLNQANTVQSFVVLIFMTLALCERQIRRSRKWIEWYLGWLSLASIGYGKWFCVERPMLG